MKKVRGLLGLCIGLTASCGNENLLRERNGISPGLYRGEVRCSEYQCDYTGLEVGDIVPCEDIGSPFYANMERFIGNNGLPVLSEQGEVEHGQRITLSTPLGVFEGRVLAPDVWKYDGSWNYEYNLNDVHVGGLPADISLYEEAIESGDNEIDFYIQSRGNDRYDCEGFLRK